jgi:hypothetical protein
MVKNISTVQYALQYIHVVTRRGDSLFMPDSDKKKQLLPRNQIIFSLKIWAKNFLSML